MENTILSSLIEEKNEQARPSWRVSQVCFWNGILGIPSPLCRAYSLVKLNLVLVPLLSPSLLFSPFFSPSLLSHTSESWDSIDLSWLKSCPWIRQIGSGLHGITGALAGSSWCFWNLMPRKEWHLVNSAPYQGLSKVFTLKRESGH